MRRTVALLSSVILVLPWPTPAHPAPAGVPPARVVVVLSSDAEPYQLALAGFRRDLRERLDTLIVVSLRNDTARVRDALSVIRETRPAPHLIVTLGTLATRAILPRVSDLPVVAGMILNPAELGTATNATAVYLEYPVEVELEWMARILPQHRRVGVVYHAVASGQRVEQAKRLASVQGIHIDGPAELPDALQQLANRADVLWSLNDPVVYNPETARPLLLFSLRNRIPMVGQTTAWVRAGALYALDRDYGDVGAQCAQLAELILGGAAPADVAPVAPRKVRYSVNARTAADLGVVLSEAVVRGATEVVR